MFTDNGNGPRDGETLKEWNSRRWRECWMELGMYMAVTVVLAGTALLVAWLAS